MGRAKSKYEPGDRVMVFTNPNTNASPIGMATLREFIEADTRLERWIMEFDDKPGQLITQFISKPHTNRYDDSPFRFPGDWGPHPDHLTVGDVRVEGDRIDY